MPDAERPQIYLIGPPSFDLAVFPDLLGRVLDGVEIACVRLALASRNEDSLGRAADRLREVTHGRDIPLVIETHVLIAARHGLDGVHLIDGARSVRHARKTLGADAIIGAYCSTTRHEGISAAESGADYVAFGPAGASALGRGAQIDPEVFDWWSEMIEVPVVAEGALTTSEIERLAPVTDFFAIGEEIWGAEDPVAALRALIAPLD